MPALPPRTTMSNPYPAPTDAQARAWYLALYDSVAGIFGASASAATARDGLLLPIRAAKNLLVNPNFLINQRGRGITGLLANDWIRDKWQTLSSGDTYTSIGGATGQLTSHAGGGYLMQNLGKLPPGTYTLSTTGSAKIDFFIASVVNPSLPTYSQFFLSSPQTFVVPVIVGSYSVIAMIANGTLGTVLLEKSAFATVAEERSEQEELLICQQFCYVFNGNLGNIITSSNVGSPNILLPAQMATAPTFEGVATTTASAGSNGTPVIYSGLGVPQSKRQAFITNSAANWTLGGQVQLNAVFVPS